jgi:branched-chain amino acid transport system substrate-binding protein
MFANGGNDSINGMKRAAEFGLANQGMLISAPLPQFPNVHCVGLKVAHDGALLLKILAS